MLGFNILSFFFNCRDFINLFHLIWNVVGYLTSVYRGTFFLWPQALPWLGKALLLVFRSLLEQQGCYGCLRKDPDSRSTSETWLLNIWTPAAAWTSSLGSFVEIWTLRTLPLQNLRIRICTLTWSTDDFMYNKIWETWLCKFPISLIKMWTLISLSLVCVFSVVLSLCIWVVSACLR